MNNIEKINVLRQSLSAATKRKLRQDIYNLKLRSIERQHTEELISINAEVGIATEQLKELKNHIFNIRHQIALIDICATSENHKIESQIRDLDLRKQTFEDFFKKERHAADLRNKELRQNEEEEENLLRQKEKQITNKAEELEKEIASVEKECEGIDRECAVLKKRNAAIMLKMRRKLIETENVRKELLKKKNA